MKISEPSVLSEESQRQKDLSLNHFEQVLCPRESALGEVVEISQELYTGKQKFCVD